MKNKKGISLIVLVITIIVIIILAAAVILTLTDNNPINNAKAASYAQSKDSVESAINLYVAQKIAATQGTYDTKQILTGSETETANMIITTGTETTIDTIKMYAINTVATAPSFISNVKMTIPASPAGSSWYIDPASNKVYLVFTTAIPTWLSGSNLDFVKTTYVVPAG